MIVLAILSLQTVQSTQNQPYFEAVVSERTVQFHQHGSFPEALKYPLLSSIQFSMFISVIKDYFHAKETGDGIYIANDLSLDYDLADVEGRSDDLLDKVYDRFASRFFEDESESHRKRKLVSHPTCY